MFWIHVLFVGLFQVWFAANAEMNFLYLKRWQMRLWEYRIQLKKILSDFCYNFQYTVGTGVNKRKKWIYSCFSSAFDLYCWLETFAFLTKQEYQPTGLGFFMWWVLVFFFNDVVCKLYITSGNTQLYHLSLSSMNFYPLHAYFKIN